MTLQSEYNPLDRNSHPPYFHEPYKSTALRSPRKPLIVMPQTLSELTGPMLGHDYVQPGDDDLSLNAGTGSPAMGERIIVTGRVLDENDRPIPDALVEV